MGTLLLKNQKNQKIDWPPRTPMMVPLSPKGTALLVETFTTRSYSW